MITINFSCLFHLIIIYILGLFLNSFFNRLYDHLIAFNANKDKEQKEYQAFKDILDQRVTEINQSMKEINDRMTAELHDLLQTKDEDISLMVDAEKKIDDNISQEERKQLYQLCQKIVMPLIKNK